MLWLELFSYVCWFLIYVADFDYVATLILFDDFSDFTAFSKFWWNFFQCFLCNNVCLLFSSFVTLTVFL